MKLFWSYKKIIQTPLDQKTFKGKLLRSLVGQLVSSVVGMSIFHYGTTTSSLELKMVGLLIILIASGFIGTYLSSISFRRLIDVHPELKKSKFVPTLNNFLPFCTPIYLAYLLYLVKQKHSVEPRFTPMVFRREMLLLSLTFLLTFSPIFSQLFVNPSTLPSFASSNVAYWVSEPLTHYISVLTDETRVISEIKAKLDKNSSLNAWGIKYKQESLRHSFTTTGFVLFLAKIVNEVAAKRDPATLKNGFQKINYQLDSYETFVASLETWDHTKPELFRINPISYISPLHMAAAAILSGVSDIMLESKSSIQVFGLINRGIQQIEREMGSYSISDESKAEISARIKAINIRLLSLNHYKSFLNLHEKNIVRFFI